MQDLNDLRFFKEIVEQGGFSAAAKKLGLPRSRISRRMAVLEKQLDVRLIQRTTRHFLVSEVGREYYKHCLAMVMEADAAGEVIEKFKSEPQGTIKLSCPSGVIYSSVGKIISAFMKDYPKVRVILESTNRHVDIIKEGFDAAICVAHNPFENSGLTIKKISDRPQKLVAAPSLINAQKTKITIDTIASLPSLEWGGYDLPHQWKLNQSDGKTIMIQHNPRYISEDLMALRQAALDGIGVCQLPEYLVRHDLETGALVQILSEWRSRISSIYIVFPSRRGLFPTMRRFFDALANGF